MNEKKEMEKKRTNEENNIKVYFNSKGLISIIPFVCIGLHLICTCEIRMSS